MPSVVSPSQKAIAIARDIRPASFGMLVFWSDPSHSGKGANYLDLDHQPISSALSVNSFDRDTGPISGTCTNDLPLRSPTNADPKTRFGVPIWPAGVVGSLAHHDTVVAAAMAATKRIAALGIDIEPNEPLPENLIELIATRTFSLELVISKNVIGLAYSRPSKVDGADYPINLRGLRSSIEDGEVVFVFGGQPFSLEPAVADVAARSIKSPRLVDALTKTKTACAAAKL
ncbi:hypothetical protein [Bradyrhizobium sp. ORS 86]